MYTLSDLEQMEQDEMVMAVRDLMARHPEIDWTMAAQSVAMSSGRDERAVVREEFEWIIITKPIGGLNADQEFTGPFEDYDAAMAHFVTMGPASSYEHKYITELYTPAERRRISGGEDVGGKAASERADLERVPAQWREALISELMMEAADMSSKELAFLLLEGMDQDELDERVRELERDMPDAAVVHH